jgi:probable HAF family extracellular repeat protein
MLMKHPSPLTALAAPLLAALLLVLATAAQAQNSSQALAINNAGVIMGSSTTSTGATHAVEWGNGVLGDLGTLPGGGNSAATAINNASTPLVVGYATTAAGATHAVEWAGGQIIDLGTLPGGASRKALGINGHGVVVGWSTTSALLLRDNPLSC